jgi:hypothetical protein
MRVADGVKHRFSAWAASRAASVKGCRFTVQQGQEMLDKSDLPALIDDPRALPSPEEMDGAHRAWREQIINIAHTQGLTFTDGVAAKLISIYMKAAFVCGGHHTQPECLRPASSN